MTQELDQEWNLVYPDSPLWDDELLEDKQMVLQFFQNGPVMMSCTDLLGPEMRHLLEPWGWEDGRTVEAFHELHWKDQWSLLWMLKGPYNLILRTPYEGQYGYYRLPRVQELK
jgi:hypothetical protein